MSGRAKPYSGCNFFHSLCQSTFGEGRNRHGRQENLPRGGTGQLLPRRCAAISRSAKAFRARSHRFAARARRRTAMPRIPAAARATAAAIKSHSFAIGSAPRFDSHPAKALDRRARAVIFELADRAHFAIGLPARAPGGVDLHEALAPFDRLILRRELQEHETGDQLLRFRERSVNHLAIASGEADARALRAWLQRLA